MTVRPNRGTAVRLSLLVISSTVAWATPSGLAQAPEPGRPSGGALSSSPTSVRSPGSPESSLGPGPGALQPSMLAPEAGLIGGRRRAGRIPRSARTRSCRRRVDFPP